MLRQFGPFLRMVEMDLLCIYGNHNIIGAIFSSQRIKAGNVTKLGHFKIFCQGIAKNQWRS